jgi:hypothetical protein
LPAIVFFITGKGPMKEEGEKRMTRMNGTILKHCAVGTAFLDPADYPKFLGECVECVFCAW